MRLLSPLLLVAASVAVLSVACGGGGDERAAAVEEGPAYVALGDSLAAGVGASDPASKGYVPVFHDWLRQNVEDGMSLHNLGVAGETTASIISDGQLARALEVIGSRNGDGNDANDVRVISIDIGANDILKLANRGGPCATNVRGSGCLLAIAGAAQSGQANLSSILKQLRDVAGDDTTILVAMYNNPFSGTGNALDVPEFDALVRELNGVIVAEARKVDAEVVDFYAPFVGRARSLIVPGDVHPNDAGHQAMAAAMVEGLRAG